MLTDVIPALVTEMNDNVIKDEESKYLVYILLLPHLEIMIHIANGSQNSLSLNFDKTLISLLIQ